MRSTDLIRKYLQNRGIEINKWGDDGFWFIEGSTIVYALPAKIDENMEIVEITSIVVRGVKIDMALLKKLLELNASLYFGAFGLEGDSILLKYTLLGGDHMDEEEFFNAAIKVAVVADEYDNKIINTHGGMTAVDFVREQLKEEDRRKALPW